MSESVIRGTVISSKDKMIRDGAVVIIEDHIHAVGKWKEINKDFDTTNLYGSKNHIISPGFVNTHSHAVQTLFRGAADDRELLTWLEEVILPGEATLNSRELEASCRIGYGEMLLSGITTTNDMLTANHSKTGMKSAIDSGIRGHVGKMLMDRNVPDGLNGETEELLNEAISLADMYPKGNRVQYAFTPRFIPTCTDKLMRQSSRLAKDRDLLFHTHASENRSECQLVTKLTGMDNIEALHSMDALGSHVILAHAIWTSSKERELIQSTGTSISHNPTSNSKLASGIAPIPDYLERGITVGLATDGSPASGGHDFLLEMRLASFLQKSTSNDPKVMPAPLLFDLATYNGAKALNIMNIGKLEPGFKADIIAFNPKYPNGFPLYDPYSYIAYSAQTRDIEYVWVDGINQVTNHHLVSNLDKYYSIAKNYAKEKPFLNRN